MIPDWTLSTWTLIWIGLAVVSFFWLFIQTAPYGRHEKAGWGPRIPQRLGWIVMESVSPIMLVVFTMRGETIAPPVLLLTGLWVLHYVYRAVVYPFRAKWSSKQMPVVIMVSAIFFNSVNGGLNGSAFSTLDTSEFWTSPFTWLGLVLFLSGLWINLRSDRTLLQLRGDGDTGYRIPQGGLYRWISCPNYLGEIIEWTGFAIMASTLPALSFAIWTIANLVPRAISHHRWYLSKFPDYPSDRRAILPFLV